MVRKITAPASLGATLAVATVAQSQPPPGSPEASALADEHFRKAKALLKEGKKQAAYAEYTEAFRLRQSYDAAGNLGSLELDLGKPRDAAQHLEFAIAHYAVSGTTKEQLEKAKARLEDAKKQVGALAIVANVEAAEVIVDGRSEGRTPLDHVVFVEAGKNHVVAKLAGYDDLVVDLTTKKGETVPVQLTLKAVTAVPPAPSATAQPTLSASAPLPPPPTSSTPPAPGGPGPVPIALSAIGAAVAASVGVGFSLAASGKDSDAAALRASLGAKACRAPVGGHATTCSNIVSLESSHDSLSNAGVAAFVAAGALGAATLGLLAWQLASSPEAPRAQTNAARVRPVPWITPTSGGAALVGRF